MSRFPSSSHGSVNQDRATTTEAFGKDDDDSDDFVAAFRQASQEQDVEIAPSSAANEAATAPRTSQSRSGEADTQDESDNPDHISSSHASSPMKQQSKARSRPKRSSKHSLSSSSSSSSSAAAPAYDTGSHAAPIQIVGDADHGRRHHHHHRRSHRHRHNSHDNSSTNIADDFESGGADGGSNHNTGNGEALNPWLRRAALSYRRREASRDATWTLRTLKLTPGNSNIQLGVMIAVIVLIVVLGGIEVMVLRKGTHYIAVPTAHAAAAPHNNNSTSSTHSSSSSSHSSSSSSTDASSLTHIEPGHTFGLACPVRMHNLTSFTVIKEPSGWRGMLSLGDLDASLVRACPSRSPLDMDLRVKGVMVARAVAETSAAPLTPKILGAISASRQRSSRQLSRTPVSSRLHAQVPQPSSSSSSSSSATTSSSFLELASSLFSSSSPPATPSPSSSVSTSTTATATATAEHVGWFPQFRVATVHNCHGTPVYRVYHKDSLTPRAPVPVSLFADQGPKVQDAGATTSASTSTSASASASSSRSDQQRPGALETQQQLIKRAKEALHYVDDLLLFITHVSVPTSTAPARSPPSSSSLSPSSSTAEPPRLEKYEEVPMAMVKGITWDSQDRFELLDMTGQSLALIEPAIPPGEEEQDSSFLPQSAPAQPWSVTIDPGVDVSARPSALLVLSRPASLVPVGDPLRSVYDVRAVAPIVAAIALNRADYDLSNQLRDGCNTFVVVVAYILTALFLIVAVVIIALVVRLKTADAREDNFSDAGWDDHDNHFGPSLDRLEDTLDRAGALNAEAEDDIDAGDGSDTANDDAGLGGANDLEEQGATRMTHQKSSKLTTSSVGTRKLPLAAKHPSRRGDG